MTQSTMTVRSYPAGTHPLRRLVLDMIHEVLSLQRLSRERTQLAELSDAALKDLGLSRADIQAECAKPVWRR